MSKAGIEDNRATEWIEDTALLKTVLDYAEDHQDKSPDKLYLSITKGNDRQLLSQSVMQIEARKKFASKLPSFIANPYWIFPTILAGEQSTNEYIARYHTRLIGTNQYILDMTAGLGIDALTNANIGNKVVACELDKLKVVALRHNATAILPVPENLKVINEDSLNVLLTCPDKYDILFADPARRSENNTRVYDPRDCLPDVIGNNQLLLDRAKSVFIKHSPMLDITMASKLLSHLKEIHIVCYKGEAKEVLTIQQQGYDGKTEVICVDLDNRGEISCFMYNIGRQEFESIRYTDVSDVKAGAFIYVPNAAVMKTGAWDEVCRQYPMLSKLDVNSHIFLGQNSARHFPGRIFKIECILDKRAKSELKNSYCNVIARNYVMDAPALAKSLKVRPGGDTYVIGTRCGGKPLLIKCIKN